MAIVLWYLMNGTWEKEEMPEDLEGQYYLPHLQKGG
jgi:hypothetical protein